MVAGVWWVSLWPFPEIPGPELPQADKLGHLVTYLGLMLYFLWLYPARLLGFLVAFAAMGGAIELVQGQLAWREASWADFAANIGGLLLATLWSGQGGRINRARRPG